MKTTINKGDRFLVLGIGFTLAVMLFMYIKMKKTEKTIQS
jgi:hypothetical protein